jgi:hypothetical protein
MGKTIRVPDPVYSKATTRAEREDVSRGTIVREWMEKAEKFDEVSYR